MRFFNDPGVRAWVHGRGGRREAPLPGLNFPVEAGGGGLTQQGQGQGQGQGQEQVFVPAGWQACNDQIDMDMRGDHPTSSVPALRFVASHIRYNVLLAVQCGLKF